MSGCGYNVVCSKGKQYAAWSKRVGCTVGTKGALPPVQQYTYIVAGAVTVSVNQGCFAADLDPNVPAGYTMQGYDPSGEKDKPKGAERVYKDYEGKWQFTENPDFSEAEQ